MAYQCALSFGRESTYGTSVAVTRSYEFAEEDWQVIDEDVLGDGYRSAAEGPRYDAFVRPVTGGTGSMTLQPTSKGMGLLLEALTGSGTSTLVSGTTYQQGFYIDQTALPSETVQKLVPMRDGTVGVQEFRGATATGWTLSLEPKGVLRLETQWDVREFAAGQNADALAYLAGKRFDFSGASFQTGTYTAPTTTALASGNAALTGVRGFSVAVDLKMDVDGVYTGNNAGKKDQPAASDLPEITVTITKEYQSDDLLDAYRAGTHMCFVATLTTPESLSTGSPTFQVSFPSLRPKGPLPKTDKGIIVTDLTYVATWNGTQHPMYLATRTADTALA